MLHELYYAIHNSKKEKWRIKVKKEKIFKIMLSASLVIPTLLPVTSAIAAEPESKAIVYEQKAEASRSSINFNTDWRYFKGNKVDANKENYNDQNWVYVNLPHSSTYYTPENKDAYKGINWYRKTFKLDKSMEGKQLLLTFEAAMQKTEVWLNGEQVLTHKGGYTPFIVDLTGKLNYDADNVIAVKVDGKADPSFAPGADRIDFQYFGALYGNAYITVKDPIHISDSVEAKTTAGGGIFITAPEVSENSATVKVKTQVENDTASDKEVSLTTQLLDDKGSVVIEKISQKPVGANSAEDFKDEMKVKNPRLWSVETPELYTVRSIIKVDGKETDREDTTYGIRKIDWRRDGLFINDRLTQVNGMNLHSETYMLGNAIPNNAIDGIVKRMKENGIDFVRMSHYPHTKAFYEACDKYGVMVLECSTGWQNFSDTDEFKNNTYEELRTIIRGRRNHPSIVAWEPSLNESGYTDAWAKEMNRITKEEYPKDGVSYAWTSGWKSWANWDIALGTPQANVFGTGATGGAATDKPVIISEYGDWSYGGNSSSTRVTRHQANNKFNYGVKGGDEGMLIAADNAQESVNLMNSKGYVAASMYWDYADYAGFEPGKLTYCGIVDVFGIEKHGAYFYRSQIDPARDMKKYGIKSGGPMVYIANLWDGKYDDGKVRVYSNCDTVKLYKGDVLVAEQGHDKTIWGPHGDDQMQNNYPTATSGKNVSAKHLKYAPITFDVGKFAPGELRAVGIIDGKEVAQDIRKSPKAASKITLAPENEKELALNGSDTKLVYIDIKDEEGTNVTDSFVDVALEISGPGIIVGPKNISARGGKTAVWVKGIRGKGDITLTAKTTGLKEASVVLSTIAVANLPAVPAGGDADEYEFVAPATTNVFLQKTVSASSENVVAGEKDENKNNAVDGNRDTKWCASSGTHPQWLQVDLGDEMLLDTIELDLETADKTYYYTIAVADELITDTNVKDYLVKDFGTSGTKETSFTLKNVKGRYVRIDFVKAVGEWAVIREISGTGSSTNIALNKAALASSENKNGSNKVEYAKYAIDGDMTTKWCADAKIAENHWWQVDLGETYSVSDIKAVFEFDNAAYKFVLQGSIDGTNFIDIADYRNGAGFGKTADIKINEVVRYIRLYNITTNDMKSKWPVLTEVAVQGEKTEYKPIEISRDKPMSASSSKKGITPEMGSNGMPGSYWIPASHENEWWAVDTQGIYDMDNIVMTWNTQEEHKYLIEGSLDGENWTTIVDHREKGTTELVPVEVVRGAVRYVRVSLPAGRTTDQGFGLFKVSGLTSSSKKISQIDTLTSIEVTAGTAFEKLGLPSEVMVKLEGGIRTKLPVVWNKETFVVTPPNGSEEKANAIIKGKVVALPGVTVDDNASEVKQTMTVVKQDTSLLKAIIDTANQVNPEEIPANLKEAFIQALTNVKALVAKADAFDFEATAERLEASKIALIKALNDIGIIVADRGDLDKLVKYAMDIDLKGYLPIGQDKFKTALAKAQSLLHNPDVTDVEIYNSWKDLKASIDALVKLDTESVNKRQLEIAIKEADKITDKELDNVVPIIAEKFRETLAAAKAVMADNEATQAQVDKAVDQLNKMKEYLSYSKANKENLQKLVNQINDLDKNKYIPETWTKMLVELDKAKKLLLDENVLQSKVEKGYDDLFRAYLNLRLKPNKDLLKELIKQTSNLKSANYTTTTWGIFNKAYEEAKKVYENPNASETAIADTYKNLEIAYKSLVKVEQQTANPSIQTGDSTTKTAIALTLLISGVVLVLIKKRRFKN